MKYMKFTHCLTCGLKLRPPTSIPRWPESDRAKHPNMQARYELCVANRADEIANQKLGYMGESHFCGQACAAVFGRGAALMMPLHFSLTSAMYKLVENLPVLFEWVEKRRARGSLPKGFVEAYEAAYPMSAPEETRRES